MALLTCIGCGKMLSPLVIVNLLYNALEEPDVFGISDGDQTSKEQLSQLLQRYDAFLLRRAMAEIPDMRWCPQKCGSVKHVCVCPVVMH